MNNENKNKMDYSLKNGDVVWFSYKTEPKEESDWIRGEIISINFAYKACAILLEGYKECSCHGIKGIVREKYFVK